MSGPATELYEQIKSDPIVSPHGHCDPSWFATDAAFPNPSELLVTPDHYVFRMLYSQGVSLQDLGIGQATLKEPRQVFRIFAEHWELFLGTPSHLWITHVLEDTLGVPTKLTPQKADAVYDQIEALLKQDAFKPRALYDRFQIEVLATTDSAVDPLTAHADIAKGSWPGRVIPTFRPDSVLDPLHPDFAKDLGLLEERTQIQLNSFEDFLSALRNRRAYFQANGATATDHAIERLWTEWLSPTECEHLFEQARRGTITTMQAARFYGHMLIEMAQMSLEDGLVMQMHCGSRRNTNTQVFQQFGRDKGADIPRATDWVHGLENLLNRAGNNPELTLILFTLDETSYARELAPMAGHWPALRIGPPWWFHDSVAGIARYFDQVVETAGYFNLAGFNDDTRAFLSIPARHDLWRRCVAIHLANQIQRGFFDRTDAERLAQLLSTELARKTYRLET
ncbi:MAG: glucuronate isomerase [Pseudomonadota bacterium]